MSVVHVSCQMASTQTRQVRKHASTQTRQQLFQMKPDWRLQQGARVTLP